LCRQAPERTWQILDIGTGSGCIAVAIAKYAGNTQVTASDISGEALAVAGLNVQKHDLPGRVRLVEADLAALPAEAVPEGGFDLIVSNPPYISEPAYAALPPNVLHEPKGALLAGADGLVMYRRLAAEAPRLLSPQGLIIIEIGFDQHEQVKAVFAGDSRWHYVATHRDRTDPHDRALEFQKA
jgi:HemK-like putative methylase